VSTVLLSIGGNDIGFVGVLSTLALPPNGFTFGAAAARYVGKEALAVCPYIQSGKPLSRLCDTRLSAEARLKDLTPAYQRLGAALADRGIRPAQVHHALYANPLIGADGQPCDTRPAERRARTHGGFEALMGVLPKIGRGPRFSTWNFELHYLPETRISTLLYPARPGIGCDTSAEPDDSEVCQALLVHKWLNNAVATSGFVPITAHVGRIDGHGLCVVGNGPDLSLPLSEAGQWTGAKTPANYDPYVRADQGRWFRVPNDSILTQFDIESGVRRFHHGTAHPTFRAHIEYGEAALRQMLLAERAEP